MSDELKSKINNWLEKHGYPLEMYVASAFQKNGFQVAQSVMYLDNETGISREVDIVAYKTFNIADFYFHFSSLIECKSTKSKPWLSFIVKNSPKLELLPSNYNATYHGQALLNSLQINGGEFGNLFPASIEKHGYSLTQAFKENESMDIPYKAIQTLNKALHFLIKKVGSRDGGNAAFYFPIVVIENPLFEVELTTDDSLTINETEFTTYLGRKAEINNSYFIVNIITRSIINSYAMTLSKEIDNFYNNNLHQLKEFVENYNEMYRT